MFSWKYHLVINVLSEKYDLLVQSELSVLRGKIDCGTIDRTGIQVRNSDQLSAFDLTAAHLIVASDVRRHMTWQALRPRGKAGQFLEGRGDPGVCAAGEGCGEAILRERGIFCLVFNMAFFSQIVFLIHTKETKFKIKLIGTCGVSCCLSSEIFFYTSFIWKYKTCSLHKNFFNPYCNF